MSVHPHCLACGGRLELPLAQLGSLRCQDCRGDGRSLDPALIDRVKQARARSLAAWFKRRPRRTDRFDELL